jgi:hypothetical protein
MHMREECPREHVYTATRPLLLVARPFVGGPQDDCVTSRAEVARPRVGRQRSRPVGCVEQYYCVCLCVCVCVSLSRSSTMSVGRMMGTVGGESSHMCCGFETGWLWSLVGGRGSKQRTPPSFGFDRKKILVTPNVPIAPAQSPSPPAQLSTTLPSHQATIHQSNTASSLSSRRPKHR